MSKKVAVIGLGKIGCRHLEALFKSIFPIELYGIDPQKSSIDIARKSIEDLPANKYVKSVSITKELKQLPEALDLVVIATNSDIRLKVLSELLDHSEVNFIILEKILFQRNLYQLTVKKVRAPLLVCASTKNTAKMCPLAVL